MSEEPLDCVGTTDGLGKSDFQPCSAQPILHGSSEGPSWGLPPAEAELTLEQIDRIIANPRDEAQIVSIRIYRQLAAVTQERNALASVLRDFVAAKDEKNANGESDRYREIKRGLWERARENLSKLASGELRKP